MGQRRNQKADPTLTPILNSENDNENASSHSPPLDLANTRGVRSSRGKKAAPEIETESTRRSTRLQSKKLQALNKENINPCEEDAPLSKPNTKTKRKRFSCSPMRRSKRKRVGVGKEKPPPPPLSPGTGAEADAAETGSNSLPNTSDSGTRKVATDDKEKEKKNQKKEQEQGIQNEHQHKDEGNDNSHSSTITMAEMQNLYAKLHGKYQKLKGRKLDDVETYIEEQNKKFTAYVNAVAEELLDHLRNDNNRLRSEANESMALNKARLLEHQNAECQSELLMERSKNLILLKEVKRLEQLLSKHEELCNQSQNMNLQETGIQSFSISEKSVVLQPERHETNLDPCCTGSGVLSNICHSGSKAAIVQKETNQNICNNCLPKSRLTIEVPEKTFLCNEAGRRAGSSINEGHKPVLEDADKGDTSNIGCARANRLFQTLLQCMLGMQFSIINERNELQLLVLHELSGLTFTLKCLSDEDDPKLKENGELLYSSVSLGTLQKIAPEWMKEDIVFSVCQVNVFFDRILQVANGRGHSLMVR